VAFTCSSPVLAKLWPGNHHHGRTDMKAALLITGLACIWLTAFGGQPRAAHEPTQRIGLTPMR
jgi:hypothetical protein